MRWRDQIYIDHCIPFGLRSAPKLFNIMADLLAWIAEDAGVSYLNHYLDDYSTTGPPTSTVCQCNEDKFISLCTELEVPLATDKLEGPSIPLSFLGIILDTSRMEIKLSEDKLARMQELLKTWLPRRKVKREIFSLVCTLHHATKVVRLGRAFVSRMYSTAARLKQMYYFTRLSKAFRSDLLWCMASYNLGMASAFFDTPVYPQIQIIVPILMLQGHGAEQLHWESKWLQWQWPSEWCEVEIMAKELVPIMFTCIIWGPHLAKQHINFQCDNASLVIAINKGSSEDKFVMYLLYSLSFLSHI